MNDCSFKQVSFFDSIIIFMAQSTPNFSGDADPAPKAQPYTQMPAQGESEWRDLPDLPVPNDASNEIRESQISDNDDNTIY